MIRFDRQVIVKESMSPQCMSFCKPLFRSHVSYNYHFTLPRKFCYEHLPCHDSAVVLVDESGREYSVLFSHLAKEDKFKFTRGWKDFVTAHGLLEGDALSFHLIDPCKFKVRIIRASRSIKDEPQDEKSLNSVKRRALQNRVDEEMVPKETIKLVYVRRKRSSRQTYDRNGNSTLYIRDSPHDGEITRIVRKEQCVKDQSSQCGIKNSKAALNFQDINGFKEFKICVNGETLDSELPVHIRMKYYQLCCIQNKFPHYHLIRGIHIKSVVAMILEIISIADAMVNISISTPVQDLDLMDRTLQSFEDIGMDVGYLLAEIRKLIKLSREHQTVAESTRAKLEEVERERKAFMDKKSRIDELIESAMAHGKFIGHLEANVDALKEKMADLSLMFKEVTDRMKCNAGKRPRRNKRAPYWAADYL